jgi:DNA-binding transcriptional LysR family regulator
MNSNFDIDALRTMVVGDDMGSFSRAAAQLGRSQSAVSMQLRKLEQQAGKPLFFRSGRHLVPTEAGEALLAYARRIIALNDEAAAAVGAATAPATLRIGLPQDLFDDVLPEVLTRFRQHWPDVHVEIRAGRNHMLQPETKAGRIDVAASFFPEGSGTSAPLAMTLPMQWVAGEKLERPSSGQALPLVMFDHPCLFRQAALHALDDAGVGWRMFLTTPSLPGIWASLRAGHGVSVRTAHRLPAGLRDVGAEFGLPALPPIEIRLLSSDYISPAAAAMTDILAATITRRVGADRPAE